MRMIALPTLNKDGVVTEALGKDLAPYIEEVYAPPDVATDILNGGVAIYIGEETKTETVGSRGGISETIHDNMAPSGVECLTHTLVKFIVRDRAPVGRFLVLDGHHGFRGCRGDSMVV